MTGNQIAAIAVLERWFVITKALPSFLSVKHGLKSIELGHAELRSTATVLLPGYTARARKRQTRPFAAIWPRRLYQANEMRLQFAHLD